MTTSADIEFILKGILSGDSAEKEELLKSVGALPAVVVAAEALKTGDFSTFYYSVTYPLKRFSEGLVDSEYRTRPELSFLFREYSFIENHIKELIARVEGLGCSADKSRTVIKKLFNYFKNQVAIEFDYSREYTFHFPKKVLCEQSEILAYFNALHQLFYGRPTSYVEVLIQIDKRIIQAEAAEARA